MTAAEIQQVIAVFHAALVADREPEPDPVIEIEPDEDMTEAASALLADLRREGRQITIGDDGALMLDGLHADTLMMLCTLAGEITMLLRAEAQ